MARSVRDTMLVDVYVCGFPCQPFSSAGSHHGFSANSLTGNGQVFFGAVRYIETKKPRVFLLENVQGLESASNGDCFATVLRCLYALHGYNVYWDLLNTRNHGIPHNRPRYFFIGIAQADDIGTFAFPNDLPSRPLEEFLEPRLYRPSFNELPKTVSAAAKLNHELHRLHAQGHRPFSEPWVIDVDSSMGRGCAMYNCSPCLTRSRFLGHWVTNRGRRLTLVEQMRLQGLDDNFPRHVPPHHFSRLLGNSMSVNVLVRLLARALPAAGLCKEEDVADWHASS